mgnify:CR=1 FL=1
MKIIYTQKRSSSHIRKRLLLAFECLTLMFVMCFFGMLLARQKLNGLENEYKSIKKTLHLQCNTLNLEVLVTVAHNYFSF